MFWWFIASLLIFAWVKARVTTSMRAGRWVYRPMTMYVGTAGTGKSYRLTWGIVRSLAQGRHVRVNMRMRPHRLYVALRLRYGLDHKRAKLASSRVGYLESWEDLVDAVDCDVFIDEAQDMLNSKDWNLIPEPVITWFAQHRHRLCTVTLASHRFGSIHNYVRDGLVANVYLVRHANPMVRAWRKHVGGIDYPLLQYVEVKTEVDESLPGKAQKRGLWRTIMGHESTPLDPVIAGCYDHTGGVLPSPLHAMRAERGKDAGVKISARQYQALEWEAHDTLPFLTVDEHLQLVRHEDAGKLDVLPAWRVLAARFAATAAPGQTEYAI